MLSLLIAFLKPLGVTVSMFGLVLLKKFPVELVSRRPLTRASMTHPADFAPAKVLRLERDAWSMVK